MKSLNHAELGRDVYNWLFREQTLVLGLLESQETAELVGNTVIQCIESMC